MPIRIIKSPINKFQLRQIAKERFGDLVKAAVDIEKEVMALGGELHVDEEVALVEGEKSNHENVWGINIYPEKEGEGFIEFDSMINIKPLQGNRTRGIDDGQIRDKVKNIVHKFIK